MTAAAAIFLVLVGAVVFVARPGARLNRTLGALLLLRGASDLLYCLVRVAETAQEAEAYHRTANWYVAFVPLLTFLLLDDLFPQGASPRRRRALLAAGLLASLLVLPVAPWYELSTKGMWGKTGGFFGLAGPLAPAFNAVEWTAEAMALLAAARAAASPTSERRVQAALLGLALALPLAHLGASRVSFIAWHVARGEPWRLVHGDDGRTLPLFLLASAVVVAGAALACALLPRLRGPLSPRARRWATALVAAAAATGALEKALAPMGLMPPGYVSVRFVWLAASAACLGLALVRHDLAAMSESARRKVALTSHVGALAAFALAPTALAMVLVGAPATGLAVAVLVGAGLLAFSPYTPLELASALGRLARGPQARPVEPTLPPRYRVERELGRGASATALLATDADGARVVLKRLHPHRPARLALAEARALAAVRHPRVVPLLRVERAGDSVVLILPYAEGGSLRELLEREGPQPPARVAAMAADVLAGLGALHEAGLVHGDVKLDNVLLDAQGRCLVGDLGCARAPERRELDLSVTGSEVVGSYGTAAPEVIAGEGPGARADLYSVAALLHRLLTGEHYLPLEGRSAFQASQAILHEAPRLDHPRVPPAWRPALARALAKRPEDRFATAAEMAEALR